MRRITFMLFAFLSMTIGFAQTETLAEWTPATNPGGSNDFGASPFAASTTADNLVVGELTRGSGIGTIGTGAANGWGGNDFTSTDAATAITENEFVTFTITADVGYTFSVEGIEPYNIRRSGTGPTTGQWQYQLESGSFVDIGAPITWGTITSNSGNEQGEIDLSGISELQNIAENTTVTFRLLLWGATATGGTWYLNGHNNATSKTLTVLGTVEEESGSTPLTYCEINSDYYGVEEITSVVFGDDTTITNTNDTDILVDFTSTVAEVEQGETYTITVKGNSSGEWENEYVAFIDWNQNGVLDDAEEVYYIGLIYDSTGYDNKTAFTDISVPLTALTGETRIRITKTYTDQLYDFYLNIDPCYISIDEDGWGIDGSYGQALDFTINVLAADPCADISAPTGDAAQEVESSDTLADLDVTATGTLTWYSDADLTSVISDTTEVVDGTTYYVTNTEGDCESDALAITVTITADPCADTPLPTGDSAQEVESGDTLADLDVTATGTLIWYSDADLTDEISDTTEVVDGTTYYVTNTEGDCESDALAITVTVTTTDPCADTPLPTAESPQTLSEGQTVADIVVTGVTGTLTWYADEDLEEEVEEDFVLEEAGSYTFYVTQTIGDCTSDAIEVVVEVTLSNNGFDMASFRTYPNPVKDFFNVVYSKEITNVTVMNILGQTILIKEVNGTDTQLDMTSLPTGNYFVKVNIDGAIQTVKVIKQ